MKLLTVPQFTPGQLIMPVDEPTVERGPIAIAGPCQFCGGKGFDTSRVVRISGDDQGTATYATCVPCAGRGHLVVATAVVEDCVPVIGANDDPPTGRHLAPVYHGTGTRWYLCNQQLTIVDDITDRIGGCTVTPGQHALILSAVRRWSDPRCIEAWPECADGDHDPRCCRFPKSCSEGREPVVEGGPTWREWQP